MTIFEIPSPALYIDMDIFERNVKRVMDQASKCGLSARPHIKAHKSSFLATIQVEAGAKGLTCAKLSEAEAMVEAGFDDILVAFPLYGKEKWERYAALNEKAKLLTTIDSMEIAQGLSDACVGKPAEVLVEIDCGTNRCGVAPEMAGPLAAAAARLPGIRIVGVLSYNGLIYQCRTEEERRLSAEGEMRAMETAVSGMEEAGVDVSIKSGGNSPSSYAMEALSGMTEVRPGNCFFNDVSALNEGYAREDDCSMRVLATVVSLPKRGCATIDAGTKTFTGDMAVGSSAMGRILGMPDVDFIKANEEHGYLAYDPEKHDFRVGDRLIVIPNHACVLPNLCDKVYAARGENVQCAFPIDARGRNY